MFKKDIEKIGFLNDDYRDFYIRRKIKKIMGIVLLSKLRRLLFGEGKLLRKVHIDTGVLFIHIPKAAGTSVSKSLYGYRTGHYPVYFYEKESSIKCAELFKFTVVRNPYARLYSAYRYLEKSPHEEDRQWFKENIAGLSFREFVLDWLDNNKLLEWKHFSPQFLYVIDSYGSLNVDYVAHLETIDEDLEKIQSCSGVVINLPHENKSKNVEEEEVYCDEMKEKVFDLYRDDFLRFGYEK